jgi:hypothetical protein
LATQVAALRGTRLAGVSQRRTTLPGGTALHPLFGKRRTGDVPAQLFQLLAVMRFSTHGRMQAEAVDVGAKGCRGAASRGIAPRRVSALCPARGSNAMRYVMAAACSGRSVRA